MKRKSIQTVLAMLLALVMVVGCSSGTETTDSSNTESTDSSSSTGADNNQSDVVTDESNTSVEGGDLVLWMPPFAGNDSEVTDQEFWAEQLQPLIDETGSTISVEVVPWDSYETKYLTGVSSGEGPDIGYMYMEMFSDYIDMGALAEIDSYFTDEEKDNYYYFDRGNFGGVQYALPIVVGNPRIFVANMDILNAAGIDKVPATLDELISTSQAIQAFDSNIVPFTQSWGDSHYGVLNEDFWPFFWAFGGSITDESGEPSLNTEAGVKTAQYLYDLKFKDNVLTDSITSLDSTDIFDMLKAGELAMGIVSSSEGAQLDEAGLNWSYTTALEGPEGNAGTFIAADSLVLFENSTNKELAAKAMKIMTSAAVMERFHESIYSAPPISKDETYKDLEVYTSMYESDTDKLIALPVFNGASSFYDTLYKNIQNMMLDDMTPEDVMESTMEYYNTSIKE